MFDADFCDQYARAARFSDFRVLLAFVLERALAGVARQGDALDVACGPGVLLGEFARQRPGMEFVGLDLSPAMIGHAQRHMLDEHIPNVQLICGDMGRLPEIFGPRRFDFITWTFGLHYCPTPEQALATFDGVAHLLRPNGVFFLVDLVRFKKESTRRWFSNKYDRDHGDSFFQEIKESYLASFSPTELISLLRKSCLSGLTLEWSRLFPVLLFAHNRGDCRIPLAPMDLPRHQRVKRAALRAVYNLSAGRSAI